MTPAHRVGCASGVPQLLAQPVPPETTGALGGQRPALGLSAPLAPGTTAAPVVGGDIGADLRSGMLVRIGKGKTPNSPGSWARSSRRYAVPGAQCMRGVVLSAFAEQ